MPDDSPATRIIRILLRWLRRRSDYRGEPWPGSNFPSAGSIYLVSDGLASSSTPSPQYTPWLDHLRNTIESIAPNSIVRGFSYSRPGVHYGPPATDMALLNYSSHRFRPYAPALDPQQQVTYAGFSLGASLFALGLGEYLKEVRQPGAHLSVGQFVPALLMVQPALALAETYIEAAKDFDELPAVIEEFMIHGSSVQQQLLDSIQTIIAGGTRVFLVYWPRDEFTVYPPTLMNNLENLGVSLRPVSLSGTPVGDPFAQHCRIAGDPSILAELRNIIEMLQSDKS